MVNKKKIFILVIIVVVVIYAFVTQTDTNKEKGNETASTTLVVPTIIYSESDRNYKSPVLTNLNEEYEYKKYTFSFELPDGWTVGTPDPRAIILAGTGDIALSIVSAPGSVNCLYDETSNSDEDLVFDSFQDIESPIGSLRVSRQVYREDELEQFFTVCSDKDNDTVFTTYAFADNYISIRTNKSQTLDYILSSGVEELLTSLTVQIADNQNE